jgi:acetolactate synthase-1/2/3 large subunit
MMNLQELQVISHHALPITIFLLSNNGYASIAQTHNNYFDGVEVGSTPNSGVSFPDFQLICDGFGIKYSCIKNKESLEGVICDTLKYPGPQLCEVFIDPDQPFSPKLASRQLPDGRMISSPLEDMSPFLPREEFRENMLIPLYNE